MLATRLTNKLEDPPNRMSITAYSVYYQLPSISGDHLLHCNPRVGRTVMTRKHLVQLMIHWNYHNNFLSSSSSFKSIYSITQEFHCSTQYFSIINALLSLSIIDLVLILCLLLISFWHPVSNWLYTDILAFRNEIHNPQKFQGKAHKTEELSEQSFVSKLLTFSTSDFLKKTGAVGLRTRLCSGRSEASNCGKIKCFLPSPKRPDGPWVPHSLVVSMDSPVSLRIKRPGRDPNKSRVWSEDVMKHISKFPLVLFPIKWAAAVECCASVWNWHVQ
jgi:hypothetical protein